MYFLWDDDALYIYSKVYDDDILDIASAEYFKGDASNLYTINGDYPWINDIVTHTINPLANQFAAITASGDAYGHYAWDNSNKDGGGWSGLCYFQNSSADQRIASAENVKTTVNLEENWYGVELRIPIRTSAEHLLRMHFLRTADISIISISSPTVLRSRSDPLSKATSASCG